MIEVFGLEIDGSVMYSKDIFTIAQEILGSIECGYNLHEAKEEYEKIWGNGIDTWEKCCDDGKVGEFYNKYPLFKKVLMDIRSCNSGKYYKIGREVEGFFVFKKDMTEKEFYSLPEYKY